jgi:hypothetical protein
VRKIFCDRCGSECVNTVAHLHGSVEHQTNRGESLGYDEIKPAELCLSCFGVLKELLGIVMIHHEPDRDGLPVAAERPALSGGFSP